MSEIRTGLYALDGTELTFENTIEIKDCITTLENLKLEYLPKVQLERMLELEATYSSKVEGYKVRYDDLYKIIIGGRTPKSKDEIEVYNNYKALEYGLNNIDKMFTKEFICELSSIVQNKQIIDYRKEPVDIVNKHGILVHEGLPVETLEKHMNDFIEFGRTFNYSSAITSCILHFYFVYVHPFEDGNGRCARAYSYLHLLKSGLNDLYTISYTLPRRRKKYYDLLLQTEKNGYDLTDFITFILEGIIDGLYELNKIYGLTNLTTNVKRIYKVYDLEYTLLDETLLNFLYTKDNFTVKNFYKKNRSKFIRLGYTNEELTAYTAQSLETLMEHNIIDINFKLNDSYKKKGD